MNFQMRSIWLGLGIAVAMFAAFKWHKSTREAVATAKSYARKTSVSDIASGSYRFRPDIYTSAAGENYTHTLLFLRSRDGGLRGLYLPLRDKIPAVPGDDGITPTDLCMPFQISEEQEQIECVVEDATNNLRIVHHWSWSGKAEGRLTPDLREIAGVEKGGEFVFSDPWQPEGKK